MLTGSWSCPDNSEQYAVSVDAQRSVRLLVVPALFDEGNKLRHFTAETMRALDALGIDSFLPDLPGTNESLAPLAAQSLDGWRAAMAAAAAQFGATGVLALRGGALVAPSGLPATLLAPVAGAAILRALLRAQLIAEREAGREASTDGLLARGRQAGLVLGGMALGPQMIGDLAATTEVPTGSTVIAQGDLGGPALWLRAEPAHDSAQSARLAALVAEHGA